MMTADMLVSMREAEGADVHARGYERLCALAAALPQLSGGRMRFEPVGPRSVRHLLEVAARCDAPAVASRGGGCLQEVPESAMTHIYLKGDREVLAAVARSFAAKTGIRLFDGLRVRTPWCALRWAVGAASAPTVPP
jgi:hypothetical protein